jgi:hypothetical protein
MLQIAKYQGVHIDAPANGEWDDAAARTLWKQLQKRPSEHAADDAMPCSGGGSDKKNLSFAAHGHLRGALLKLKTALNSPELQAVCL